MAFMRLFLQDAQGEFSCSHGIVFDSLPRVGTIVHTPGRPSLLVKAVRPALPARDDDEQGLPACVYAVAIVEQPVLTVAPMGLGEMAVQSEVDAALVAA